MQTAIIGLGSFGSTLAGMLDHAGWAWLGHDPAHVETPPLNQALKGAEVIVMAVKEADLPLALEHIRPWIDEDALVLDCCARKVEPCAILARQLGPDHRHVGCHPRFGARSVAAGLPLEVTLCASGGAPGSLQKAEAFWEGLGCRVVIQTPELNDQTL
jgi:prephenate dehydrogenase